jgi:hypothetical protein
VGLPPVLLRRPEQLRSRILVARACRRHSWQQQQQRLRAQEQHHCFPCATAVLVL